MPFTLVIYSQSQSASGYTFFKPLTDQSQTPIGNGISTPAGYNSLLGGYVVGANAARGRISAPSLRKWANYYIAPADAAANPSTSPPFQYLGYENIVPITVGDELDFEIDNSANSERDFGFVWLGTGSIDPTPGTVFTAEFTSSTTLTANAWTLGSLTATTPLEAGLYQIVGMFAHFNGGVAARLVFPGALAAIRPGVIASSTSAKQMPPAFRYAELGLWGIFQGAVLPQVEFLGTAATTSERVYLDLVKGPTGLTAAAAAQQMFGPLFTQHAQTG